MYEEAGQLRRRYCWNCGAIRIVRAIEVGHHPDNGAMIYRDIWECPNHYWWKFWHYETEDDAAFYDMY